MSVFAKVPLKLKFKFEFVAKSNYSLDFAKSFVPLNFDILFKFIILPTDGTKDG